MNTTNTAPLSRRVSNAISYSDVMDALYKGLNDFARAPLFGLFFGGFYAIGGYALLMLLEYYRTVWLILPLALGFPLIGPFVAAGLYEVSRRLERKEPLNWPAILAVVWNQSRREMGWMAFSVLFIFWIWIYQIRLLLALFMGYAGFSLEAGWQGILANPNAYSFFAVGTAAGAALAAVLFCTTVVSMPLLLDKSVDFITAIIASWRSTLENIGPMIFFGIIVAALSFIGIGALFLGLFLVLPVLGHATWHLYRKLSPRV